jgi:hypothetical protein
MPKELELKSGMELINKIQSSLLTSYHIVDRIKHPKYYGEAVVPEALVQFKEALTICREKTAKLLVHLSKSPDFVSGLPAYNNSDDLSQGSQSHHLVTALVLSSLGIGECGECATKMMIELSQAGYSGFAKVGISFLAAPAGAEKFHSFVIANLPKPPSFPSGKVALPLLLASLPKEAIIVDPFLGVCFKPNQISQKFEQYLAAYGKATDLISFEHFYNVSKTLFNSYLSLAERIKHMLISDKVLPDLSKLSSLKALKSDAKEIGFVEENLEVVTLPIVSQKTDSYLNSLDEILGEGRNQKIVKKDEKSSTVSFPSFWLKQLGDGAIQELSRELSVEPTKLRPK